MKKSTYVLSALLLISLEGCVTMGNERNSHEPSASVDEKIKVGKMTNENSSKAPLLDDKGRLNVLAGLSEREMIGDEQVDDADFGTGINRRIANVVHKKGQPWHLVVFAQRPANKWQMIVDQEINLALTKGLKFSGTVDSREGMDDESPVYQCLVNGKKANVFGFMTYNTKNYSFKHAATGKELVWTLDGNDKLVSLAKDKVECKVKS